MGSSDWHPRRARHWLWRGQINAIRNGHESAGSSAETGYGLLGFLLDSSLFLLLFSLLIHPAILGDYECQQHIRESSCT
jgi:hypothetical protein